MSAYLFLLAAICVPAGLGIIVARYWDQMDKDNRRRTYRVAFPADLDEDRVVAWVRATTGTLRTTPMRIKGLHSLTFEMWATSTGIEHRLRVPYTQAEFIVSQLRSLVPGVRVEPVDNYRPRAWTWAAEFGLTHTSRQLRIYSVADLSASILASVQPLRADETMLVQWTVTPAPPAKLPIYKQATTHEMSGRLLTQGNIATRDEVNDRRGKLAEPNVMAVLRVAAQAENDGRANGLVFRVRSSLAATHGPSTRFHKRFLSKSALEKRVNTAAAPMVFPMQLSATELSALIAWPIGNPRVPGLPATQAQHIPVSEAVPRTGRIIGRSNFPGSDRPIGIDYVSALKHMHISGPTGVGKTVLLANMVRQDVAAGYGVVVMEAKGDLFRSALDYIPYNRMQDVIILDVNDTARPVGFNLLQQGSSRVVIDEVTNLFEKLYDTKSVWTREVLYHGLRTLATDPNLTFVDLAPLLVPMSQEEGNWRDSVIRSVGDKELLNFWQRFQNQARTAQDRITAPVMDRIWQLNARPELRNIVGQSTSSFQMADVVLNNKILLVNLANLPRDSASLTGTLLMNALWHAVKTHKLTRPTFLYLDEFQDFMNLPIDPEDMLAKARGFGLGMVLAHQHLDQLPTSMKQAILTNARSKVVFQTGAADASVMSREFGSRVSDQDFINLGPYEAVSRIATDGGVSAPFTLATNAPAARLGLGQRVRDLSRDRYGRSVAEVEAEIEARRITAKPSTRRRPKLSGADGW